MRTTLFRNVRVIDGSGAAPFAAEVRVAGTRIAEIARDGKRLPAGEAEVIDGAGATLMPGLIEAHGHLSFLDVARVEELAETPPERHALKTIAMAKRLLDQGFTAMVSAAAAKAPSSWSSAEKA